MSKHHSHDYEDLNKAIEKYKEEITASLEPMEKQLMTNQESAGTVRCNVVDQIFDQQAAIEDEHTCQDYQHDSKRTLDCQEDRAHQPARQNSLRPS